MVEAPLHVEHENLRVSDLMIPKTRVCNSELIKNNFIPRDANPIFSFPLSNRIEVDQRIWTHSKDGLYSVKTAYHVAMTTILERDNYLVTWNWMKIWNLIVNDPSFCFAFKN